MENLHGIACELLSCGYFDLEFLDNLIGAYHIELDFEEIRINFGKIDNINILIDRVFEEIKNMFLRDNEDAIKDLGYNSLDFEYDEDYEIFTNYLDSHLWFKDEKIDAMYQERRKY